MSVKTISIVKHYTNKIWLQNSNVLFKYLLICLFIIVAFNLCWNLYKAALWGNAVHAKLNWIKIVILNKAQ